MKYFKILVVVWLMFFAGGSFASETTDCSEIEGGVYVQKNCTTFTSEEIVGNYPIRGLPDDLASELKPEHLRESLRSGELVVFSEASNDIKIFPPKVSETIWSVSFEENKFLVESKKEAKNPSLLWIGMVLAIMNSIVSGLFGRKDFSPKIRATTIGIVFGVIVGGFVGGFTGMFAGVIFGLIFGAIAGVFTGGFADGFAGAIAGVIVGGFTGVLAGEFGITAPVTLEWIGFCFLLILLEYLIVFGRIKFQKQKEA